MAQIALTLRIDAEERAALETLSEVEGRPVHQLITEAIKSYLISRGQTEPSLEAAVAALRQYRKQDPGFERALDEFVEAEATLEDSLEGEPIIGDFIDGQFEPAGPVQSKIRELLGA
jgi:predicted transcriptional regulator